MWVRLPDMDGTVKGGGEIPIVDQDKQVASSPEWAAETPVWLF